jgi:hypothetical protein
MFKTELDHFPGGLCWWIVFGMVKTVHLGVPGTDQRSPGKLMDVYDITQGRHLFPGIPVEWFQMYLTVLVACCSKAVFRL